MIDNLVKQYPNSLPKDFCDFVIQKFESSENKFEGITLGGVNKSVKSSTDLMINLHLYDKDWVYIYEYLMEVLLGKLVRYVGEIPFMFGNANFENRQRLIRGVQTQLASTSNGNISVQMQRYVGEEGYYVWHYENQGGNSQSRQLFYIFYLNDVEGGETEILFNPEKIEPRTGNLLLAPAFWTHTHRGNPPLNGQYKYIITGWIENLDSAKDPEF
jgi:hypothetical protein